MDDRREILHQLCDAMESIVPAVNVLALDEPRESFEMLEMMEREASEGERAARRLELAFMP